MDLNMVYYRDPSSIRWSIIITHCIAAVNKNGFNQNNDPDQVIGNFITILHIKTERNYLYTLGHYWLVRKIIFTE